MSSIIQIINKVCSLVIQNAFESITFPSFAAVSGSLCWDIRLVCMSEGVPRPFPASLICVSSNRQRWWRSCEILQPCSGQEREFSVAPQRWNLKHFRRSILCSRLGHQKWECADAWYLGELWAQPPPSPLLLRRFPTISAADRSARRPYCRELDRLL